MANYLTEAQMNLYFGWIQGSDMPSVYVHLSGRDVDDAVLKANGITAKEKTAKNQGVELVSDFATASIIESMINRLVDERVKQLLGT